jgi:hypothetical protein
MRIQAVLFLNCFDDVSLGNIFIIEENNTSEISEVTFRTDKFRPSNE